MRVKRNLCCSRVSLHHPPGVGCSLREAAQVRKYLNSSTQHTQVMEMSVSQEVLLLLQTLRTQHPDLTEEEQPPVERRVELVEAQQWGASTSWKSLSIRDLSIFSRHS